MCTHTGVMEGVPSSRGYTGGFAAALMEKDLHLALQAGRESHSALPMTALAHQLYSILEGQGSSHKDFSAIFELIAGTSASSAAAAAASGGGGNSNKPDSK
jgi:3-hydroxyisobutyrate dehydrogenase